MRLHLFEWNDQPWLPEFLRAGLTRYLSTIYSTAFPPPRAWAERILDALNRQQTNTIVDLCSGSGGPLEPVLGELAALGRTGVEVIQTDLYPLPGVIAADARQVPRSLPPAVRTMFAAFHHFRPEDALAILRDARDSGSAICIFEGTSRSPLAVLGMLFTPLGVLFLTPRIRPLKASQLIFTYLIPVIPLLVGFDGFVSALRTYTVEELNAMTAKLASEDYEWQAEDLRMPGMPFAFPLLIGKPK